MARELSPDQLAHLMRLTHAPSLDSQLPWRFANGMQLTCLNSVCQQCRQPLNGEALHGDLRAFSPTMMMIDAVSYCAVCHRYQGLAYRVFDDLHFEGMGQHGWGVWSSTRSPRGVMAVGQHVLAWLRQRLNGRRG